MLVILLGCAAGTVIGVALGYLLWSATDDAAELLDD